MLANPERLFERSWRPRHPLRRPCGPMRRWGMITILLVLASVIFGYIYLTDAQRVRTMASAYLSELLGGEVTIGKANLTIFEGLRLDDVTLRVDKNNQADSIIFHARTFLIRYHPKDLLAGRISATQIVAIDPIVYLVENPDTQRWNYQRMWHGFGPPKRKANDTASPMVLPQIILRDAEVAYEELRNGKTVPVGWYSLEGNLNPSEEEPDRYDFQLQSRGREAMGPSVNGTIRTEGGVSEAHMQNFTFGPDIKAMLLAQIRQWCEWHQLQGRIDVPEMFYNPNPSGGGPIFRAQLVLSDVEMAIHPQEWMSREQNQRVESFHGFLDTAEKKQWFSHELCQTLRRLSTPEPIHFNQVSGNLSFSEKGLELKGITGKLENNWFNIDGNIDGYSPDAPARLTISSVSGRDLEIPEISPDYLGSLPREVQDVVEHLHPRGTCSVKVEIERPEAGGKPNVRGQIDIRDGEFQFADFPYPISRVEGRITVGPDPVAKMTGIRVLNLRGHGPQDGPNADSDVSINGFIGPLDGVSGVWLDVRGSNMVADPALREALPPGAQQAMRLFDPEGRGEYPKFRGDFVCEISRPIGPHKPWRVDTDIQLQDGEGILSTFPYPLKHLSGRLEIRDGYLNVVDGRMRRGDRTIGIDGIIHWKTTTSDYKGPYGPDLHLTGTDIPIDDDLRSALPAAQRTWMEKAGVSGMLDLDGHIFPAGAAAKARGMDVDYTFNATLHDGAIQPPGMDAAISGLTGKLHLTPNQLELTDLAGTRGDGSVAGRALIDWSTDAPKITLSASAKNLQLSDSVYQMLPQSARDGWDAVHPQGTVDVAIELAQTLSASPDHLDLHIVPRDLSVTPASIPYRLDKLQGDISVSPDQVILHDLKAKHGNADISISGQGQLGKQPAWDLKLSASQLPVDDELRKALPQSVSGVLSGLKVSGNIGVELSKLAYWPNGQPSAPPTSAADVDFAAKITMQGASFEAGIPGTNVQGTLDMAGLVRDGNLHRLAGRCSVDSMMLAGREASDFKLSLDKASDDPAIQISHVEGQFASGDIAGDGTYAFPADGPSRYDLSLVLRDADVQQLTTPYQKNLKGRLTASLQLGGNWDDPDSRRGHGDVTVLGDDMYNIPVMLGLMQITNLGLPVSSPFTQISTRYAVDGQKVTFEKIDLKSKDMSMSGSGDLDFGQKRVSLWLVTDNPTLVALPFVGPLLGGANQELLRIHIKGTIQDPKVSASAFDTVTTTVDQVFRGNDTEHP